MSGLKLGAHMSIAGGVSNALDAAADVQSNAVQVFMKSNRQWKGPQIKEDDVSRWNEQMPAKGVAYAVSHASYLINLASPKDDLWEKSVAAFADELERAHAYGIRHVVLHPGAHVGSGEEAGMQRIADALNRIHAQLPQCSGVITLLELMAGQGTTLGYTFAQLARIIELVAEKERVGVCLDTCHALAAGYDFRTAEGYEAMMTELEETVGIDSVGCWHFNDSSNDHGSRKDRHEHIGEGYVGAEGFRHILNDLRWDGVPMLLETPKKEDGDGKDEQNLRALAALVTDPPPHPKRPRPNKKK
ncbi:MAG: deoxyribonuclease IV [Caldilineaceae bacterium SB0662_bin_25]|nr:deoxyribonuclease IV [Caldilineaceae bacterium SB0662_bin_25]